MSKSDSFENGWMLLVFNNTNFANVGDATGLRGSSTAGSLYVSLHTADPGEAGTQATNEAAYTGYVRVAVARSSGGWTVSTNSATNAATVTFAQNTGAQEVEKYVGIGTASSGAGVLLYSAELLGTPITITATNTGTDTLSATSSGFANGNAVRVRIATGGTIATGLSTATQYFIVGFASGSPDTFQLSLTVGGAAVHITAAPIGTMTVCRDFYSTVGTNATPSFAAGQLTFTED